jgi:excisionase family DNA binding protein
MDGKVLMRVDEAAEICSLGRSKMYALIAEGEVPCVRIGRAVRVPAEGLRKWIASKCTPANTE